MGGLWGDITDYDSYWEYHNKSRWEKTKICIKDIIESIKNFISTCIGFYKESSKEKSSSRADVAERKKKEINRFDIMEF